MRYTDEGPMNELCKWSVDLGMLPSFQQNAAMPNPNGFYTEFELGLELDSAGGSFSLINSEFSAPIVGRYIG